MWCLLPLEYYCSVYLTAAPNPEVYLVMRVAPPPCTCPALSLFPAFLLRPRLAYLRRLVTELKPAAFRFELVPPSSTDERIIESYYLAPRQPLPLPNLLNIAPLKEGFILNELLVLKEPLPEDGALTLRTIYLLFVGEGNDTIFKAISPISSPNFAAIDSKSASFSAAIL